VNWLNALFSRWTWLMAWRDSRTSRRRLLLFSSSISLGIAALVAIGSLGRNLERAIAEQAKALLGADLVLSSRTALTAEMEALFARIGGEQARETSFSTMLQLTNGTRLVNARALAGNFPFYGELETEPPGAASAFRQGGGVLVEEGVLQQFDAGVGDTVKLGSAGFRILGALRHVPGDTVAFSTIAPRVYLSAADLPATGLVGTRSLARYRLLFRLPASVDPDKLRTELKPELERLRLGSDTVKERQQDLGRALENLYRFLNLVALIALLLGAVGIASAIHVHVQQKLGNVAVLRCLGAPLPQTFAIYLAQGLSLGAVGSLVGIVLGVGVAQQLPELVRSFVPFAFKAHFDWVAALIAAITGFALCVLFAVLPLLDVRRVPPLAAIRAAYETPRHDPLRWVLFGLIAAGVAGFATLQTRQWWEGLAFAAGLGAAFLILTGMARLIAWSARRLTPPSLPFAWRQGLANLHRPQNRTGLLLVAIGLGTFLILTLHLTRDVLLTSMFPANKVSQPNAILFDIQPDQRDGVVQLLGQIGLPVLEQAPIVTMRLARVKGMSTDQLSTNRGDGIPGWVLRREYRSTWRTNLTSSEDVVAGKFVGQFPASGEPKTAPIPVSVEDGIARDLKVTVGDELVWDVQGVPLTTRVASVRKVDWQQVRPNFYVVFPGGSLEAAPAMHVLATRVANATESARLQRELVQAFPNVSAIDLTLVLQTLDGILTKIGFVIRFMALFTVATGLIVLAGAVLTGRWQRVQESILLRTLGATRPQIRRILFAEYLALGLLAALTGIVLSVGSSWALAKFAFKADYVVSPAPLGVALLSVTTLTVLVGLATSRGIADQPPLEILRQEG
jgi:putative ABC transport system permease protein